MIISNDYANGGRILQIKIHDNTTLYILLLAFTSKPAVISCISQNIRMHLCQLHNEFEIF